MSESREYEVAKRFCFVLFVAFEPCDECMHTAPEQTDKPSRQAVTREWIQSTTKTQDPETATPNAKERGEKIWKTERKEGEKCVCMWGAGGGGGERQLLNGPEGSNYGEFLRRPSMRGYILTYSRL